MKTYFDFHVFHNKTGVNPITMVPEIVVADKISAFKKQE
jgi:hypothetical protein